MKMEKSIKILFICYKDNAILKTSHNERSSILM